MKRLLILSLLLPFLSTAKVPVESDIKARIEDPASEQYYPNLRLRYEQADSTLTADDYHYLYYGYAYQPQYRPLETNPALDRFYEALARLNVDAPTDADLQAVIAAGSEALESDPFSPQVLNFLSFAYAQLGDTAQAAAYRDKMSLVLATIESSGDGLTSRAQNARYPRNRVKNTFCFSYLQVLVNMKFHGISEIHANRNRFRPYFLRLCVCRNPSTNRKQKIGKAALPISRKIRYQL